MIHNMPLAVLGIFLPLTVEAQHLYCDPAGDESPRLTDTGVDGPVDFNAHQLPDIRSSLIGTWAPADPEANLFEGSWDESGLFFRLDLELSGLVNPPGPLGCCGDPSYEPFRYGPNPVYGYIEIDMDDDVDTGGEIDLPRQRYVGNIARYGGRPRGNPFKDRVAIDTLSFDSDLESAPYVERSGEEFHIALVGWEIDQSGIMRSDESDWVFEAGETWVVPGYLFQRAHGYRQFSTACCRAGAPVGSYEPRVSLRFSHDPSADRTLVSLVYPLTNEGSAAAHGDPTPEPLDPFFTNHNSILEALTELKISAIAATPADRSEPEFALIEKWEFKDPADYIDPTSWRLTVLVAGSYTAPPGDGLWVWSDAWPNPLLADFDGNGTVNAHDLLLFNDYLAETDGLPGMDADGQANQQVNLLDYGPNFSLFDVNNDGSVNSDDRLLVVDPPPDRGSDLDGDDDADHLDFSRMQACLTGPEGGLADVGCDCLDADMDRDEDIDQDDIELFELCATGPGIPIDHDCDLPPGEGQNGDSRAQ